VADQFEERQVDERDCGEPPPRSIAAPEQRRRDGLGVPAPPHDTRTSSTIF